MSTTIEQKYISVSAAARRAGCSRAWIWRLIRERRLRAFRPNGRKVLLRVDQLDRVIEGRV